MLCSSQKKKFVRIWFRWTVLRISKTKYKRIKKIWHGFSQVCSSAHPQKIEKPGPSILQISNIICRQHFCEYFLIPKSWVWQIGRTEFRPTSQVATPDEMAWHYTTDVWMGICFFSWCGFGDFNASSFYLLWGLLAVPRISPEPRFWDEKKKQFWKILGKVVVISASIISVYLHEYKFIFQFSAWVNGFSNTYLCSRIENTYM